MPRALNVGTGALAAVVAALAASCGRSTFWELDPGTPPSPPAGRVCLEVCLEVEDELRDGFGVAEPCQEPAWASTPLDCAACDALFGGSYGVSIETPSCRDCRDEISPARCGTPPPSCPLGSKAEVAPCTGSCDCGPLFTGRCVPCS